MSNTPAQAAGTTTPAETSRQIRELLYAHLRHSTRVIKTMDLIVLGCAWIAGIVGLWLFACLFDHWIFPLPRIVRWAVWLVGVCGSAYWLVRWVAPLVLHRINPAYAARRIELTIPEFKNGLISWLELEQLPDNGVPKGIMAGLARHAARFLHGQDPASTVDSTPLIRLLGVVFLLTATLVVYTIVSPKSVTATGRRVLMPWSDIASPTRVQIVAVKPGSCEYTQGKPLDVAVELRGIGRGDNVAVKFSTVDGQLRDVVRQMQPVNDGRGYSGSVVTGTRGVDHELDYWIEAGDARSGPYRVTLNPLPSVIQESVTIDFPKYTKLPSRTLGEVIADVVEGSTATVTARANQPLTRARIELHPEVDANGNLLRSSSLIDMRIDDYMLVGKIPLRLNPARDNPTEIKYRLRGFNKRNDGNEAPAIHSIRVLADLPPEISLTGPDSRYLKVLPRSQINLEIRANDPDFGLSRIALIIKRDGVVIQEKPLLESEGATGRQVQTVRLIPSNLSAAVGDRLEIVAAAHDNRHDPDTGLAAPNITLSLPLLVEIVDEEQFANEPPNDLVTIPNEDHVPQQQSERTANQESTGPKIASDSSSTGDQSQQRSNTANSPNNQKSRDVQSGQKATGNPRQHEEPDSAKSTPDTTNQSKNGKQGTAGKKSSDPKTQADARNDGGSGSSQSSKMKGNDKENSQSGADSNNSTKSNQSSTDKNGQSNSKSAKSQTGSGSSKSNDSQSTGGSSTGSGQSSTKSKNSTSGSESGESSGNPDSSSSAPNKQSKGGNSKGNQSSSNSTRNATGESQSDDQTNQSNDATDAQSGTTGRSARATNQNSHADGNSSESSAQKPANDGEAIRRVEQFMRQRQQPDASSDRQPSSPTDNPENKSTASASQQNKGNEGEPSENSQHEKSSENQSSASNSTQSPAQKQDPSTAAKANSSRSTSTDSAKTNQQQPSTNPNSSDSGKAGQPNPQPSDGKSLDKQKSSSSTGNQQASGQQNSPSPQSQDPSKSSSGSSAKSASGQQNSSNSKASSSANQQPSNQQSGRNQPASDAAGENSNSGKSGTQASDTKQQPSSEPNSESNTGAAKSQSSNSQPSKSSTSDSSQSKSAPNSAEESSKSNSENNRSSNAPSNRPQNDPRNSPKQGGATAADEKSQSKNSSANGSNTSNKKSSQSSSQKSSNPASTKTASGEKQSSANQSSKNSNSQSQSSQSQSGQSQSSQSQSSQSQSGQTGDSSQSQSGSQQSSQSSSGQAGSQAGDSSSTGPSSGGQPGTGNASPGGSASSANQKNSDTKGTAQPANAEFSSETTQMALDYLARQKDQPDPELLRHLDWTDKDLADFVKRWEGARDLANSKDPADQKKWHEALRDLGLQVRSLNPTRALSQNDSLHQMQESRTRIAPPEAIRSQWEVFQRLLRDNSGQ